MHTSPKCGWASHTARCTGAAGRHNFPSQRPRPAMASHIAKRFAAVCFAGDDQDAAFYRRHPAVVCGMPHPAEDGSIPSTVCNKKDGDVLWRLGMHMSVFDSYATCQDREIAFENLDPTIKDAAKTIIGFRAMAVARAATVNNHLHFIELTPFQIGREAHVLYNLTGGGLIKICEQGLRIPVDASIELSRSNGEILMPAPKSTGSDANGGDTHTPPCLIKRQ